MASEPAALSQRISLPALISGPTDIRHIRRELEALDQYVEQVSFREPGKQPLLPKSSRLLDLLANNNNINLLVNDERTRLSNFLIELERSAPIIHLSLASDPSAAFTAKLVAWFRTNIHPHALLQIGLQPNIVAGCMVRTSSKWFDLSLRNRFSERHELLVKAIAGNIQR